MRKVVLVLIAAACILSSCQSVFAIDPPEVVTTVDYRDYEYVTFTGSNQTELVFITSEVFSDAALTMQFINYYPSLNETKYKFTSNEVEPDPDFVPEEKDFFYQDITTGRIYIVEVDYTGIQVPTDPLQIQYDNLLASYTGLQDEFLTTVNNLVTTYEQELDDLAEAYNTTINSLISNYSSIVSNLSDTLNATSEDLSLLENITNSLEVILEQFRNNTGLDEAGLEILVNTLYDDYMFLASDLNITTKDFLKLQQNLSLLQFDYDELDQNYSDLQLEYAEYRQLLKEWNSSYNQSYQNFLNKSARLAEYQNFETNLQSFTDEVYFNGRRYITPYYHDHRIKELEDAAGMVPIYLVIVAAIACMACFLIFRSKLNAIPLSPERLDSDTGYPREASMFDKFSLGHSLNKVLRRRQNGKVPPPEKPQQTPPEVKSDSADKAAEQPKSTPTEAATDKEKET